MTSLADALRDLLADVRYDLDDIMRRTDRRLARIIKQLEEPAPVVWSNFPIPGPPGVDSFGHPQGDDPTFGDPKATFDSMARHLGFVRREFPETADEAFNPPPPTDEDIPPSTKNAEWWDRTREDYK